VKIVVLGMRGFPNVQGGIERHCEQLYSRLVRLNNIDVLVFTRTPYIPKPDRIEEWKGIKFCHLWCPRQKSFEAITHTFLGVLKARGFSPDILHIHAIGPSLLIPMARAAGLRVVMTHHGPDYERDKWSPIAKEVLKAGERAGVRWAHQVIVISKILRNHLKRLYGVDSTVIPNGVTPPMPIAPGEGLSRWGLEPGKYIFTACRFVPEKGLHVLLKAYGTLQSPGYKLVIAGDADHETHYSREIKRLAAKTAGVLLTGFVSGSRLGELFSNAGLFVLPSYYEGLPIVLLEAMSYGLPLLVSDIPQHLEINLDKHRYFPVKNVRALAEAINRSMQLGMEPQERDRYAELMREVYNWDRISERTMEVYKTVLEA
jgi:glycosyltransferase involved in cell wall biosynthesis